MAYSLILMHSRLVKLNDETNNQYNNRARRACICTGCGGKNTALVWPFDVTFY